jgi:uncharacterized membrane protein
MPSAQRSITVHRPVAEVFAFFTDPANDRRWRQHVTEVSTTGPIAVGSRVHQVVRGPGGRGIPADLEVVALEPLERYGFQVVAGPVRPTGEYRFGADGDTTTVSLSLAAALSGWKKLVMARAVQTSMDTEVAGLDRAKALLEGESV